MNRKKVVVLGGGTGTFVALSGLKNHRIDLTAVVSVADDGGSTGILRDELGVLPPGDIRQCLVALSADGDTLRTLFTYRFHEGSLSGHNFGNLFLSVLEKISGDPLTAIEEAQRILHVRGKIIPVSGRAAVLCAELEDGTIIQGEHAIDDAALPRPAIKSCFYSAPVPANPGALSAIREADAVVLGPGDLYTSLIPVLLVEGVADALAASQAKKILVTNLVTKRGQTEGFTVRKFFDVVAEYISPAKIDRVIVNSAKPVSILTNRYALEGEYIVKDDLKDIPCRVIRSKLLADGIVKPDRGDSLRRSFLRHDPAKLARAILGYL